MFASAFLDTRASFVNPQEKQTALRVFIASL